VRGHFEFNAITGGQTDKALAHFAGDMSEDEVLVIQLHPEHGSGQDGNHLALELYSITGIHIKNGIASYLMGFIDGKVNLRIGWIVTHFSIFIVGDESLVPTSHSDATAGRFCLSRDCGMKRHGGWPHSL